MSVNTERSEVLPVERTLESRSHPSTFWVIKQQTSGQKNVPTFEKKDDQVIDRLDFDLQME